MPVCTVGVICMHLSMGWLMCHSGQYACCLPDLCSHGQTRVHGAVVMRCNAADYNTATDSDMCENCSYINIIRVYTLKIELTFSECPNLASITLYAHLTCTSETSVTCS